MSKNHRPFIPEVTIDTEDRVETYKEWKADRDNRKFERVVMMVLNGDPDKVVEKFVKLLKSLYEETYDGNAIIPFFADKLRDRSRDQSEESKNEEG